MGLASGGLIAPSGLGLVSHHGSGLSSLAPHASTQSQRPVWPGIHLLVPFDQTLGSVLGLGLDPHHNRPGDEGLMGSMGLGIGCHGNASQPRKPGI